MSNVPLPRPGPLGLIQYAGVDMLQYAGEISAAKDAEIAGLRAELFAHQVYIRVLCKAVDAATDFAGTVAGGASWWDDVWAEHFRALDAARAELIKSLADNAALRADAIDRQNNVVAPLRERVRVLEDARPEPDCRTCKRAAIQHGVTRCTSPYFCTNGDRYEPLPPMRLWRTA